MSLTTTRDLPVENPNSILNVNEAQAYRIKALKSLADYQKTGLHVTQTELQDWLKALKNGQLKALPSCHN